MVETPPFEVRIDGNASAEERERIEDLFREFGTVPKVRADYGIGGGLPDSDLVFWIVVIISAKGFFETFGAEMAKRIVQALWNERAGNPKYTNGSIVLYEFGTESSPDFSVTLEPDLPEPAYVDLSLLAKSLKRGKVMYSYELSGWIVDDRELRSEIKHLYDNFVFSSTRTAPRWWEFWLR
jgi:hypothetical protein